jgi:hypothetical protein
LVLSCYPGPAEPNDERLAEPGLARREPAKPASRVSGQRRRCFCRLRRLRAFALGRRGGGRLPEADFAGAGGAAFFLRFFGTDFRASRMIRKPITTITMTPATKRPNTPSVLIFWSFGFVFGLVGVVGVGAGAGVGCAGGIGANGLPPGAGVGVGLGVWAEATDALSASASSAARVVSVRNSAY